MNAAARRWVRWASAGVVLLAFAPLGGQEAPSPIKYRRVYVPQADLDQQIRGLLPLRREEFERRMDRANALAQGESPGERAHIQQATYQARLDGDMLVGTAVLDVQGAATSPALLVLDPCNLAVADAIWLETPPRPARIGSAPDDRLLCLAPQSGRLEIRWRLAGRRDQQQGLAFHLELPPSPINRLQFDLPAGAQLKTDRGLAVASSDSTVPERSAWIVEAGGADRLLLQITESQSAAPRDPLVLVEETTAVNVQQAALDVQTTLELNVLHQELGELALDLDEPLKLLQVRMGEAPLGWTAAPTATEPGRVLVHLPTAVSGRVVLNLSGIAAWSGGRGDVPRFRLPSGVWQEGRAAVTAPAGLQLQAEARSGCSQIGFTPATAVRPLDEWEFQYHLPEAAVAIAAADAQPQLVEISGTSLDFQATQVHATLVAEFSAVGAARFDLEGQIPRAWIVDAVEVQPAEMLEDRSLVTRGAGPHVLRVSLRRPIAKSRPLVLIVRAHRRRPPSEQNLDSDFWAVARFSNVRDSRRLVQLSATDPASQISLSGDENLQRLDPASLSSGELRLLDSPIAPLVFEQDQGADAMRVRLAAANPRYRAEIHARADVEREGMRQSFQLRIEPEDSAIDTLLARFAPPPPEPIRWSLAGEEARELTVRRVAETGGADEAVFEIKLQRPRRTPFAIQAECASPLGPAAVSLPSLPAASSQAGLVQLHAHSAWRLAIDARELRSVPPLDRRDTELSTLRAVYRYQPGRAARLAVTPLAAGDLTLAWVESRQIASRISADGSGDHEARFVVQSRGRSELVFRLPPSTDNLRIAVGGRPLDSHLLRRKSDEHAVPLAPGNDPIVVQLSYNSPPAPFGWRPWSRLAVPIAQPQLPVLETTWQVHVAPGLHLGTSPLVVARPASRQAAMPGAAEEQTPSGWSRYEVAHHGGSSAELLLYRSNVITVAACCLALSVAGLLVRVQGNQAVLVVLAVAIAAGSLALRPEWLPLVQGAAWGLLLGGGAALLRTTLARRPAIGRPASRHGSTARLAVARMVLCWLALALVFSDPSESASQEATSQKPPPAWRRVVIPVDDQRQPVGDYVFVEPELYDALLRLTGKGGAELPKWLLESAVYRASSKPASEPEKTAIDLVEGDFEFETFENEVQLALGFERKQVHLAEGRTRLDGRPAVAEWSPEGRLEIAVPSAGKHRLELAFSPAVRPADDALLLDLAAPRVSDTVVHLQGELAIAVEGGQIVAAEGLRLGPVGRLALRRAAPAGAIAAADSVEAQQLVLWKVRPGSVVADGKFRLRPLAGTLQELAIDFDSRLRVLPLTGGSSVARSWIVEGTSTSTLHVVLATTADSETTIPVSFLWPGVPGTGALELPTIKLRAGPLKRDWAALVLDGGLSWKSAPAARAGDPAPADFAAAWGGPLLRAVVLDRGLPMLPALVVEPAKASIQAAHQIDCSVSLKSVRIQSRIRLAGVPEHAFGQRLRAGGGLRMTKIAVHSGKREIRSQWNQAEDGTVHVQLAEAPAAELQIEVEGQTTPARLPGRLNLPLVEYQGASASETTLRVYRQPDVQLSVEPTAGAWKSVEDPNLGRYEVGLGRLAAVVTRSGSAGPARLQLGVSRNVPQVEGLVVARLTPERSSWEVHVEARLQVTSGQLDALRLELPVAASGPIEISPAAEHELSALGGQTIRRLVVRPQRAVSGQFSTQIRIPLAAGADLSAIAPLVALPEAPRVRRVVVLPRRNGEQAFDWETSGLQAIEPLAAGVPADLLPAGHDLFEAVAPRPSASVQLRSDAPAAPRVLLASHAIHVSSGRRITGTTMLDVLPGGARQFTLAMPPNLRLIHASCEEIPAQLSRRGGGRWTVMAASSRLPQRIEVTYSGSLSPGASPREQLATPWLVGAEVERSVGNLSGEPVPMSAGAAAQAVWQEWHITQLEGLAAALEAVSTASAGDLSPAVLEASFSQWEARFQSLPASELPAPLAARAAAAQLRAEAAHQRLVEAGVPLAIPAAPAGADLPDSESPRRYWVNEPPRNLLEPFATDAPNDSGYERFAWSAAYLALAAAVVLLVLSVSLQSWLARHAHFVLAAAGAVWLVAGPVPWLAALVVPLAIWLAIRSPWPRASADQASSILRRPERPSR